LNIFHYLAVETEKLKDLIDDIVESDHKYLLNLLTHKNSDGETPLHIAIRLESPKAIEIILNALIHLEDFKLSKIFYPLFADLI
jgi:ankyrin repeat protein